jgi:hypothetical protein
MPFKSALCIKMCQAVPQDSEHAHEHLYIWQQPDCKLCGSRCHSTKNVTPLVDRKMWGNTFICPKHSSLVRCGAMLYLI